MDIVERLRRINAFLHVTEDEPEYDYKLSYEAANEIERLRSRLENPTEEMLMAGRAANRLVAGNALGLACIAPDTMWKAMADIALKEDE
jgi:hypothetical protein